MRLFGIFSHSSVRVAWCAAWMFFAMAIGVVCAARGDVPFSARTLPEAAGLTATVETVREGDVWRVSVTARNDAATNVTFKLVLVAEPGFPATRYLIPGVNYNGNGFVKKLWNSLDIPTGWEKDGEPWVFAYDRCSIPSCTVSENEHEVFALFASTTDAASHVSSCSLVRNADGSFRHLIYWPVTEAPVSYTDKRKFSRRYDTYLTLRPHETFTAYAFACHGTPPWRNYGFAAVFPVAWRLLGPDVPSQLPVSEVLRLDKAFMDWGRRRDGSGSWYHPFLSDVVVGLGNHWPKSVTKGATIAEIEKDPSRSWWLGDALEKSKRLKPGEYLPHAGSDIGFCGQSFQLARLSVEYGLRNHSQADVDFGLAVFRSWIRVRQLPSGHFARPSPRNRRQDASSVGWGLAELARLATLLKVHGLDAAEFERAAEKLARAVIRTQREDGNLGAAWNIDTGEVLEWSGDSGGFVLMGLVRHWLRTRDDAVRHAIDRAFAYYYGRDIDCFECKGGAMDCASIDREGIHPFFTAAVAMYADTGEERFRTYAQKAGWYFLSWLYCHNGIYGPETDFAKYDWKPAGSTIIGTEHAALDDYGCAMVADLVAFSRMDGNPLWRDVAALIWRNATQGFPTETRKTWLGLERPLGAKNEAYFQTRWSKYRTGERKRGHLNSHCTAWAAAHRATAIYDLSAEDLQWLERVTRPVSVERSRSALGLPAAGRVDLLHLSHVHRGGGKLERPDNTLKTFKWCWENGSALECDCRKTKDGVGVMLHDADLDRHVANTAEDIARFEAHFEKKMDEMRANHFKGVSAVSLHTYYDPKAAEPFVPRVSYLKKIIAEFHANGIPVCSIPFEGGETEEVYFRLHELGCDGFSTDYPSVMFSVIRKLKER